MATIVQVAQLARVSTSTVSHVLNGTRPVSNETRQRVLQAIEETSYRQDALARAMRRSQTDSVGLIVSDAGEPAFAEMVRGVEQSCAQKGITLLLANSAEEAEREQRAVRTLLERRVDGLILARVAGSYPNLLDDFDQQDTPVVLMDRLSDASYDQAGVENREPTVGLVRHFAAQGHQRLLLVVGDERVSTLRERLEAFSEAISLAGLSSANQIVITARHGELLDQDVMAALQDYERPTAVIACSTVTAAVALRAIQRLGLSMPDEIAFATFDGFAYSDLFEPQLTTVRQPAFEVGAAAAELLFKRLIDKTAEPSTVRLMPSIAYRSSSGPSGALEHP